MEGHHFNSLIQIRMTDTKRQRYHLKIALANTTAVECITYMDMEAVQIELALAEKSSRRAVIDSLSSDNDPIYIELSTDICLLVHQKYDPPAPSRIAPVQLAPDLRRM